jgi:gamma-glutamylcyclotransferase (GGCT)/AIG2-like uncharacterized protein YtfP
MPVLSAPPSSPIHLDPGRCLLFAYGQLQPGLKQPRSLSRAWPDRVRGMLYDLGPFPAAVKVGAAEQWLGGYVLEITEVELVGELDPYEQVHKGLYRRIQTVTQAGFEVWIYEYAQPVPVGAVGPIDCWPTTQSLDNTGKHQE